jgi:hypothetical protein
MARAAKTTKEIESLKHPRSEARRKPIPTTELETWSKKSGRRK